MNNKIFKNLIISFNCNINKGPLRKTAIDVLFSKRKYYIISLCDILKEEPKIIILPTTDKKNIILKTTGKKYCSKDLFPFTM